MEFKDYYQTLGVSKNAKKDEIKRAYRKLARKYHPDVSQEANAEEKFKEVKEAYEVLNDPEKRKAYDTLGPNWKNGQDFTPPPGWEQQQTGGFHHGFTSGNQQDFSDFFEELFGQQRGGGFHHQSSGRGFKSKGQDAHVKVLISLEDAFSGATRQIALQMPEVTAQGQIVNKPKTLNVKIPKGIMQGQQIRLTGQGGPGLGGGPNGDLYLEVEFQDHPQFSIEGKDIYATVPIAPWEAALGAKISAPTLNGKVNLTVPANSQSGKKLRLKGKGLPAKTAGDQYVVLQVVVPPADTEAKRKLYKQMAEEMAFEPRG